MEPVGPAYPQTGNVPDVHPIFPNVEMRLDAAAKSGFINIHLLVSRRYDRVILCSGLRLSLAGDA